jgi:hypothetical protein
MVGMLGSPWKSERIKLEILNALKNGGYLTEMNVRILSHFAQKWKMNTYDAVLETHIMSDQSLADAIADIFKLDRIYSFDASDLELNCLKLISFADAKRLKLIIPNQDEDGTLQIFILNPLDEEVENFLRSKFHKYRHVILDRRLMIRALEEFYPLHMQVQTVGQI